MSTSGKKVLVVIDLQNDYFPEGKFPLWNTEEVLSNVERTIARAKQAGVPVVLVQHVGDADPNKSPFFNVGTPGVELHPRIRAVAGDAPVVSKTFADAFHETNLEDTLHNLGAEELLLCGMMTQNCVTHTAVSKAAEKYKVTILPDCSTSVSPPIHMIALHGVSTRADLVPSEAAL